MALGSKNNNKRTRRLGMADRKAIYTSRKNIVPNRPAYREQLAIYEGHVVEFNGVVRMGIKDLTNRPVLLGDVMVGGVHVDHIWVQLGKDDWKRLQFGYRGCRVYMKGRVKQYMKIVKGYHSSYGLCDVELARE